MRILLDLQSCQGENGKRGIGHYSFNLAESMIREGKDRHEFSILLNARFLDEAEKIKLFFEPLVGEENIYIFESLPDIAMCSQENFLRMEAAELLREAFIAQINPDWVQLFSLFEGYCDEVVTSIGKLGDRPTSVIFYDLIPYLFPEQYLLSGSVMEQWYYKKLFYLKRANLFLSISENSAFDLENYLEISRRKIVNIGGDVSSKFKKERCFKKSDSLHYRKRFMLDKKFLLYVGGDDYRKNLYRVIEAYALLPQRLQENYQLMLVISNLNDIRKEELFAYAKTFGLEESHLRMIHFVVDNELDWLYSNCSLFVFPSLYEGLGLPILEAMWRGAPILTSNVSSMPEIAGSEELLFDPYSPVSIASKIVQMLTDEAFRKRALKHNASQIMKFSWKRSSQKALAAIESSYISLVKGQ